MDQTNFDQNQQVFQAPPEELQKQANKEAAEKLPEQKKKLDPKIIILGIAGFVFLVSIIIVLLARAGLLGNGTVVVTPTPPPVTIATPPPRAQTEFGKRLENIETQINQLDPADLDLDPPPLNYQIRL